MGAPITRYVPSRQYLYAGLIALTLAIFSAWCGLAWTPAFLPAALFVASAAIVLALAFRPAVEIHESHLSIGKRHIPWQEIRRIDRSGWVSPLVLYLTLASGQRVVLIYPGDVEASNGLLRHLRRAARGALLDGQPYPDVWRDTPSAPERKHPPAPRYRLLTEEDEAEVERLYQRLKTVGNIDTKSEEN